MCDIIKAGEYHISQGAPDSLQKTGTEIPTQHYRPIYKAKYRYRGTEPITKNRRGQFNPAHYQKEGLFFVFMIKVFDKNGNELEPTYPKRARGLVKKGRARFIRDDAIVLEEVNTEACPPIQHSEDMNMFDNNNFNSDDKNESLENFSTEKFSGVGQLSYDSALAYSHSINTYFGEIYDTKTRAKSVYGSLSGTVIAAGEGRKTAVSAFDGRRDTLTGLRNNYGEAVDQWFGVRFDEPTEVHYIMVETGNKWGHGRQHAILGSYFQGSNDGKLWTTLAMFTEEDYIAYLNSEKIYYTKPIDCPMAYTYYRYFNYADQGVNALRSLLLFGDEAEMNTLDTYHGEITYTGVRSASVCGSLSGEIIGAGGNKQDYCGAFDGNSVTTSQFGINIGNGVDYWFGIKTDEPTALSHIVLASPDGKRRHVIRDSYFQGSDDGVTWTTLAHFDDGDYLNYLNDVDKLYYRKDIADSTPYTYYRYFNYDDGGVNSLGELLLFKADEAVSTLDTYHGEITYTGVRSLSLNGSVAGEVIGAGAAKFDYVHAFNQDITSQTVLPPNLGERVYNWFGVKTDAPTTLAAIAIATQNGGKHHAIRDSYFQGSGDGVTWVTLAQFTDADYHTYRTGGKRHYVKEIKDPTPYTYFRYFNYNDGGANRLAQLFLYTAERVSNIQYLDGAPEAAPHPTPTPQTYGAAPAVGSNGGYEVVKKYVTEQIDGMNQMLMSSQKDLLNALMRSSITAKQYEERLGVVQRTCDNRMLQLKQMLAAESASTPQPTPTPTVRTDFRGNIQTMVQNFLQNQLGYKVSARVDIDSGDPEDMLSDLEDMLGDLEDTLGDFEDKVGEVEDIIGDVEDMIGTLEGEDNEDGLDFDQREDIKARINDIRDRIQEMFE